MKFASIVTALLAASLSSSTATVTAPLREEDVASTPVRIIASCVGADLSKLDLMAGLFVAGVLESTYNSVVADDDSDDSELTVDLFSGSRATIDDGPKSAGTLRVTSWRTVNVAIYAHSHRLFTSHYHVHA
jgi:hypothetical protein